MSAEEHKAVIRRLIEEVYNEDNQDVLDELVTPDVLTTAPFPNTSAGLSQWCKFASVVFYLIASDTLGGQAGVTH